MSESKTHLTPALKASMARQSLLPHGFQKDQSESTTKQSIKTSIALLQKHRPNSWHLVLVAAYTGFNFSRGVQILWQYIDDSITDRTQKVHMGAQMRDGILKCIPFIGIPRVLKNIAALKNVQKPYDNDIAQVLEHLRDDVAHDAKIMMEKGQGLWDNVYGPKKLSDKLTSNIAGFHPNLARLIIQSSYGHAMSATSCVGREDTSAIAVTVLRVEEDVLDQLTSHVFGLLKGGGEQAYAQTIIDVVDNLRSGNMASLAKAKL